MNYRTKIIQSLIHFNESIFFYPKLSAFYRKHLSNVRPLILDVGANKGQTIDFFLKINQDSTIHSFEPNKKLFTFIKKKYLNGNIFVYNVGVSSEKGILAFHENFMDETSTFEAINYDSKYLDKKAKILGVAKENIIVDSYKVNVVCLSDFIKENEIKFIDVLKIDVEGHELKCLQGLFNGKLINVPIKYIQLERHFDDMYLTNTDHNEIEKLLAQNYFEKVQEIKHGFGDFSELIYEKKNEA